MKKLIVPALAAALLTACGGGGGSDTPSTPPTTAFALDAAYKALTASGSSRTYNVSGTCSGTGSIAVSTPVAGTFEASPALVQTSTLSITVTGCTGSGTGVVTSQSFVDSNYRPLGSVIPNQQYSKFGPVVIPTTVKVGDTGIIGTSTAWTTSAKTTPLGTGSYSYVVEPETDSSVIVKLITKSFSTTNALQYTEVVSYRLSAAGGLTQLVDDISYSTGTHLILTPR